MRWSAFQVMLVLAVSEVPWPLLADDGVPKEPAKTNQREEKHSYLLVVPPAGGQEVKLAEWRFRLGTRRLDLSSDPPRNFKARSGAEYLEFREEKSTTFQDGILSLVPLASVRKIEYDIEKKIVQLTVAQQGGKDVVLTGTTRFKGINKITIEADAILEGLGAATVKFQGGSEKESLHRIRFSEPQEIAEPKGISALIEAQDKEKTRHRVWDLQPLYHIDGGSQLLPYVMFKKTVKIDIDRLVALRFIPSLNKKEHSHDFEIALQDGSRHILTLLTRHELGKNEQAKFEGFLGRVATGYKLFPIHTIQELRRSPDGEKH